MIRIVICLDVETDSPSEAYEHVYKHMQRIKVEHPEIDWESTDDWFGPDGAQLSKEDIAKIRLDLQVSRR